MPIKSNSLPIEEQSPFHVENKNFCEEFETYISSRNGLSKGTFNAWTYYVSGKIVNPKEWVLSYNKSNYSSLKSVPLRQTKKEYKEYVQSLIVKWETILNEQGEFKIQRKTLWDEFILLFSKKMSLHPLNSKYIVISNNANQKLIHNLSDILKPFFYSEELFQIILKKNHLSIQISTNNHHFKIFEKLEQYVSKQ